MNKGNHLFLRQRWMTFLRQKSFILTLYESYRCTEITRALIDSIGNPHVDFFSEFISFCFEGGPSGMAIFQTS